MEQIINAIVAALLAANWTGATTPQSVERGPPALDRILVWPAIGVTAGAVRRRTDTLAQGRWTAEVAVSIIRPTDLAAPATTYVELDRMAKVVKTAVNASPTLGLAHVDKAYVTGFEPGLLALLGETINAPKAWLSSQTVTLEVDFRE